MALEVEDGTGKANAESYVSVADADAYFTARAVPAEWAVATSAQKEGALRYATRWLDNRYAWPGTLHLYTQALAWPRDWAADRDGRDLTLQVPVRVEEATAEAAALYLAGGLLTLSLDRGGAVASETVGPLSTSYFPGASGVPTFPFIDQILASVAAPVATGSIQLVRG